MAQRLITIDLLNTAIEQLNVLTNSPLEYSDKETGKANVGHFTFSCAYGGYILERVTNDGGAMSLPLGYGRSSKRELLTKISAFISGISLERSK